MAEDRPAIPEPIKRAVRQRCKFGCVICGSPIYDIDYIEEWSGVQKHEVENLTLLCKQHHFQKGQGIIPLELIKRKTENITQRDFTGFADLNFTKCKVVLGDNLVGSLPTVCFWINGRDFLKLEPDLDNYLVKINAAFYNPKGKLVFGITDNQYQISTSVWDVEAKGKKLIFRNGLGDVFLTVEFNGEEGYIKLLGRLYFNSEDYIELTEKGVFYEHVLCMSRCVIEDCTIGLLVGSEKGMPIGNALNVRRAIGGYSGQSYVGMAYTIEMLARIKDNLYRIPRDR